MHLQYRDVNHAFYQLVRGIHDGTIPTVARSSRAGDVLMVDEPVLVTYQYPEERVLFNTQRDANPFFHLFEALWMLAGRNDVQPLVYYNSRMSEFSDDGSTFHGAYGHRWRQWFGYDQLKDIITHLKKDPDSRRVVLQMWDATCGPPHAENGRSDPYQATHGGRDVPCNTQAYFALRHRSYTYLDMTVCNRSNDMIWGMLGANYVHFSMLQEYLAQAIGVQVGLYHQFTNNLHTYVSRWDPDSWRNYFGPDGYQEAKVLGSQVPLVEDVERFDEECARFIGCIDGDFQEPFLRDVAQPMCAAFRAHKQRRYYGDNSATTLISRVVAGDWRLAGTAWLLKRQRAWESKSRTTADEASAE